MFVPISVVLFTLFAVAQSLVVSLPKGDIRGHKLQSYNGSRFYAFQEIPYAAPPVGDLRFQPPKEPDSWDGILNTTKNTKICHQWNSKRRSALQTEDCLYLNVYTPVKPGTASGKSVLVFFYGGTFITGDATYYSYGPQFHMDFDVVVVTVNYRLGAFGFLSTQDTTIPGNYGLKDQLLALKWVKENIHIFGGDSDKVTINGQSAGSAMVGYHILSKQSKGLFRGAIMHSGSPICSWAVQRNAKTFAYKLAEGVDSTFSITRNSSEELLELLRSVSGSDLNKIALKDLYGIQLGQGDMWAPVIEPEHEGAFITEFMHESLKNGDFNKVPLIIGINSEERIKEAANIDSFESLMTEYDDNLTLIVNEDFNIKDENKEKVAKKIREIYTDGAFHDDLGASIRFKSDVRYTTSLIRHAYLQSQYTDVYFYEFAYHGLLGLNTVSIQGAQRVAHTEQMRYIWNIQDTELMDYPANDQRAHTRFLTLITNFVKYLNPTPVEDDLLKNITWPLLKRDSLQYLNINHTLKIKENPKEYKAWSAIIDEYGVPPFDTY